MIQICFKLRLLMIFCSTMFLQVNEMLHCYTISANCTMFHEASEPGNFPCRGEHLLWILYYLHIDHDDSQEVHQQLHRSLKQGRDTITM